MLKSARTIVALGLILVASMNAFAGTTLYTDEASFAAAIPSGYYLESFSAFAQGSIPANPLSMGPVNGLGYELSAISGLYSGGGSMSTVASIDPLVITFTGAPVYAVGGNFWLTAFDFTVATGSLAITVVDGFSTVEALVDATPSTFRGFVSTAPISSITLMSPAMYVTLDNLYVAGAPAVAAIPAPGAILLGAVGTGFIGWIRRRRSL